MFQLFQSKNPYEQPAKALYGGMLSHVRKPVFYTQYEVPDTLDGRFDLLILHLYMAMHVLTKSGEDGKKYSQSLFDIAFADMDQTLREVGIGDMGIHKHMRRMMKGFNGRVHTYEEHLDDKEGFMGALKRNLYGTVDVVTNEALEKMYVYVQNTIAHIQNIYDEDVMSVNFEFLIPGIEESKDNEQRRTASKI